MSFGNFVPEIWSAALLQNLRDQLIFGGLCNRDYEGDVARAGDTVHITSFADPSTRSYSKNTDITFDQLSDTSKTLTIQQADYFAFTVDDIDRRQALGGFIEAATQGASYNLAADADTYLHGLMVDGVDPDNKLTSQTVGAADGDAYDLLVSLRTKLTRSKTPASGRWVVVPPEMYAVLLKDDRFIRADASGSTAGLRNGQVGRAAGFDVIESNLITDADLDGSGTGTATAYSVVAGHDMATTYVEQIASLKAVDLEKQFGEGVKGLHLYDGLVVRPSLLAVAEVTVS